jgi:hypothetical protein
MGARLSFRHKETGDFLFWGEVASCPYRAGRLRSEVQTGSYNASDEDVRRRIQARPSSAMSWLPFRCLAAIAEADERHMVVRTAVQARTSPIPAG